MSTKHTPSAATCFDCVHFVPMEKRTTMGSCMRTVLKDNYGKGKEYHMTVDSRNIADCCQNLKRK